MNVPSRGRAFAGGWGVALVLLFVVSTFAWDVHASNAPVRAGLGGTQNASHDRQQADQAFPYTTAVEVSWPRLALEELTLLALGSVYYYSDERLNSQDWQFGYEWSTLRRKLVGDGYAFDDNYFNTNFLSHPGSGALYYSVARANHLGVGGSLLTAFVSSAVWEMLGEFRERVSINDAFVTPLAGFAFGESMIEVGGLFDRSCDSALHRVLGSAFATAKAVNDHVGGLTPLRTTNCDRYGMSRDTPHRFDFSLTSAGRATVRGGSEVIGMAGAAGVEIENLRELGRPGTGFTSFSDGNLSALKVSAMVGSDRVRSGALKVSALPAGVHSRALYGNTAQRVWGSEWLAAFGATVDYTLNRQPGEARDDLMFVLGAPASLWTWRRHFGTQRLELGFAVAGALGGATSLAQADYVSRHGEDGLSLVSRGHGYNHVAGVITRVFTRWRARALELDLEARADRLFGLLAPDARGEGFGAASVRESRRTLDFSLVLGSVRWPRWLTTFNLEQRRSAIGDTERSLTVLGVNTGVALSY